MSEPLTGQSCLFCGGDATAPDHLWHCDGKQGAMEAAMADAHPEPSEAPIVAPGAPPAAREPFVFNPRWEDGPPGGVTLSKREALELLREHKSTLVEEGRRIALELIDAHGTTYSREVLGVMHARGLLNDVHGTDHWLGAVFHGPPFVWTGQMVEVEAKGLDVARGKRHNIHKRYVKLWRRA